MQDLLTAAIELTAIASLAYFSAMFVLGWSDRRTDPLEQPTPVLTAEVPSAPVKPAVACLSEARIADGILPFIRPQPKSPTVADLPDWSALDPFQLRKECAQRGIRWRNLHGKNRHAKKAEMVSALENWEQAVAS